MYLPAVTHIIDDPGPISKEEITIIVLISPLGISIVVRKAEKIHIVYENAAS